jgi:hypothetical protein
VRSDLFFPIIDKNTLVSTSIGFVAKLYFKGSAKGLLIFVSKYILTRSERRYLLGLIETSPEH